MTNQYPQGQLLSAPITNGSATARFGTHIDYLGTGGYRAVADIEARDAIPTKDKLEFDGLSSGQRRVMMLVAVEETATIYILHVPGFASLSDEQRLEALQSNDYWMDFIQFLNTEANVSGGYFLTFVDKILRLNYSATGDEGNSVVISEINFNESNSGAFSPWRGTWSSIETYTTGDYVYYKGGFYKNNKVDANTNEEPPGPWEDDEGNEGLYWDLVAGVDATIYSKLTDYNFYDRFATTGDLDNKISNIVHQITFDFSLNINPYNIVNGQIWSGFGKIAVATSTKTGKTTFNPEADDDFYILNQNVVPLTTQSGIKYSPNQLYYSGSKIVKLKVPYFLIYNSIVDVENLDTNYFEPVFGFDNEVDWNKQQAVVSANSAVVNETDEQYFQKSFIDEISNTPNIYEYKCRKSRQSDGTYVYKWFRSLIQ